MTTNPNAAALDSSKSLTHLIPRNQEDVPVDVTGIERSLDAYKDTWLAYKDDVPNPNSTEEAAEARKALLEAVAVLARMEVAAALGRLATAIKDMADDHVTEAKDPDGQVTDVKAKAFVSGLMNARAAVILSAPIVPLDDWKAVPRKPDDALVSSVLWNLNRRQDKDRIGEALLRDVWTAIIHETPASPSSRERLRAVSKATGRANGASRASSSPDDDP